MNLKDKHFTKNNLIFWLFFSSIFLDYLVINKIYYIFYLSTFLILFYDLANVNKVKIKQISYNRNLLILITTFFIYSLVITILHFKLSEYKIFIKICTVYFSTIYLFFQLNKYGKEYIVNFYKHFTFIINILAIVNIFEIISEKSLFYTFIASDFKNRQTYAFGTDLFRTFSIFEHPIVYGLFLVILFWCNKFTIKNKIIRYIFQFNVIINLFFTQSRSDWIAFIVILMFYHFKSIIDRFKNHSIRIRYKNIFNAAIIGSLIIIIMLVFSEEIMSLFSRIIERFIVITNDSYGDVSRLQRLGAINIINNFMLNNGVINFFFGNGFGSSKDFMLNNTAAISSFLTTDNQYLSLFYEFGFLGLLLYISIVIYSIILFFKNDKTLDVKNMSIICFLCISIGMFFFESFGWTNVFIFLIINMTFMCVNINNNKE